MALSAGRLFREAVAASKPLQIVGAINAYSAIMAEKTGIYIKKVKEKQTGLIILKF